MVRDNKLTSGHNNGIPPRTKALMAVIAIVTLIAILLVPGEKEEAPPALPEMAAPPPAEQSVPLPLPPVGENNKSTTPQRGGDTARTIVTKLRAEDMEAEPDELFTRAEHLQGEGQLEDAYLLYRLAARQGHVQAALVLGTQADPAFHTADTSILTEADPQQANKWYSAAAVAGNEEAVERLKQLRAYVEQSAADGNAAAQRLMLQWR